jgi:cytochrome c
VTALLLYWNGIIQESDVMDARSLPKIPMPNRDGFVPPRPEDIRLPRCRGGTCP